MLICRRVIYSVYQVILACCCQRCAPFSFSSLAFPFSVSNIPFQHERWTYLAACKLLVLCWRFSYFHFLCVPAVSSICKVPHSQPSLPLSSTLAFSSVPPAHATLGFFHAFAAVPIIPLYGVLDPAPRDAEPLNNKR